MDRLTAENVGIRAAVFLLLVVFYVLTAPNNHATALDAYGFAYWIAELPVRDLPELRVFMWLVAAKAIFALGSVFSPDVFQIFVLVNAALTAGAVLLIERVLVRHFGVSARAAWITTFGFALSYGVWRYATELEVYAFVNAVTLALLYAAFATGAEGSHAPTGRLVVLAVCGALATLCYQPIGIVAGGAIGLYFLVQLGLRRAAIYGVAYGAFVIFGLLAITQLTGLVTAAEGPRAFLDTDNKPLVLPGPGDLAQAALRVAQNFLSVNWSFAWPTSREFIEDNAGGIYRVWLHPAGEAGPGYLVFFVTLPIAGVLALVALALLRKAPVRRAVSTEELALLVFILANALMVLLIDPTGFEPWIPALAPVFLWLGVRVVGPLVEAGQSWPVGSLLAVMLVHNWFAGLDVFAAPNPDYRIYQAGKVLDGSGPDDLFVVGGDWGLERYLLFASQTPVLSVGNDGETDAPERIADTLAAGGVVTVFPGLTGMTNGEAWVDVRVAGPETADLEVIVLGGDDVLIRMTRAGR